MMRLLLILGLFVGALAVSLGIALILQKDPGYTAFSIAGYTVQMSFALAVFFQLVFFIAFYFIVSLTINLFRARRWKERHDAIKAHKELAKGLEQMHEGRWKAAEKSFTTGARFTKTPEIHLANAARAAHNQGVQWRSLSYLRQLENSGSTNRPTPKLIQADILMKEGDIAGAIAILTPLLASHRNHPRTLNLLIRCYMQIEEWEKARKLLPDLDKSAILDDREFHQMQMEIYTGALNSTGRKGTLETLHKLWLQIPVKLRSEEALLATYAGQLRDHGAASEAEMLLRSCLNERWSQRLIVGYGEIGRGNPSAQLANAEQWLKKHDDDPYLLLTCGRLAKRSQQWDKARDYLQRSIKQLPMPDSLEILAEVYLQHGEKDAALQCYQTATRLLTGRMPALEGQTLTATKSSKETAPVPVTQSTAPSDRESAIRLQTQPEPAA